MMDKIAKQIQRARRRLTLQTALAVFPFWFVVAFSICFIGMLVPKIWHVPYDFEAWSVYWLGGAAALAIFGTAMHAMVKRPSTERTALEIDNRFHLRERISSALLLSESEKNTSVGCALIEDAVSKVERIDVRDEFPIKATPKLPWILLPSLACAALYWVSDSLPSEDKVAVTTSQDRINRVKAQAKSAVDQLQRMKKEAEEKGLEDIAAEYDRLQKKLENLQKEKTINESKLLADLNEIKKDMQSRKDSLGSSDSLKKALKDMKDLEQGPASQLAKAFQKGDFDLAEKELGKLMEQLSKNTLSDEQKQKLATQLKQLDKAIEKAKEQQKAAAQELKKEAERAKQAGDLARAGQLQKKAEQMEEALKKAAKSDKICEQCKKAAEALEKGDNKGAQKALEEMKEDIEALMGDAKDLAELEEMMNEMQEAKEAKAGNSSANKQSKKSGDGMKQGKGEGDRPEEETEVDHFDAQVREQVRKGEHVYAGKVGGANRKGITREQAKESVLNAQPDDPDAIESLVLPKAQKEQQREYFESLRK